MLQSDLRSAASVKYITRLQRLSTKNVQCLIHNFYGDYMLKWWYLGNNGLNSVEINFTCFFFTFLMWLQDRLTRVTCIIFLLGRAAHTHSPTAVVRHVETGPGDAIRGCEHPQPPSLPLTSLTAAAFFSPTAVLGLHAAENSCRQCQSLMALSSATPEPDSFPHCAEEAAEAQRCSRPGPRGWAPLPTTLCTTSVVS